MTGLVDKVSKKSSGEKNDTSSKYLNQLSKKTLEILSQFWYCPDDYSKYVELVAGYSQNNSGQFTINVSNFERDIVNAINIRKLRDTKENKDKIYEILDIMKKDLLSMTDFTFLQVECLICSKIAVAPKLSQVLANKKLRKGQLQIIDQYVKDQRKKYWPRRYLSLYIVTAIILIAVIALFIVTIVP